MVALRITTNLFQAILFFEDKSVIFLVPPSFGCLLVAWATEAKINK